MEAKTREIDGKRAKSNEKRLESLRKRQSTLSQRQNVVKNALNNSEYSVNTKITFDSEEELEGPINDGKANKHVLFESDSEDEQDLGDRFKIKPQFEGEHGRKLLRLQKKFGDDERFQFDARFADNKDGNVEGDDNVPTGLESHELADVESEKTKKKKKFMGIRYDPTNSEHTRFEVKSYGQTPKPVTPKKATEESVEENITEIQESDGKPVVSKERYYQIGTEISEAFRNERKEDFSLLSLFGPREPDDNTGGEIGKVERIDKKKNPFLSTVNPFKFEDSTDEEDEDDDCNKREEKLRSVVETSGKVEERQIGPSRCFFFGGKDSRLKEGTNDFCRKTDFKTIQKTFTENKSFLKRDFAKKRSLAAFLARPKRRKLGDKHGPAAQR